MATDNRLVTLTPDPSANRAGGNSGSYYSITAGLVDNATYGPISSGGWQVVDRPKQIAATQWFDRAPYKLEMNIILDGSIIDYSSLGSSTSSNPVTPITGAPSGITGSSTTPISDVEQACSQISSWMDPVPTLYEPPFLSVSGPIPGTEKSWILYELEFGEAIRDVQSGKRIQQQIKVILYEYNSPLVTVTTASNYSPAGIAIKKTQSSGANAFTYYTVIKGDTLAKIAAKHKKGSSYIALIKSLNKIRDNSALSSYVGKKIKLPS